MRIEADEIQKELDLEFLFERESLPYKLSRGVSGMQINAKHCPVASCGDSRWRVYLNAETGRGNCFVCNASFTKLSFIKEHFQLEWRETFDMAQELLKEQGWRPKRTTAVAVEHGEVKLPFSMEMPTEDGSNLQYLEQRGVTAEYAKYFSLRYCEFGWWEFEEDGQKKRQPFDNRVIIPVFDLDGTLVTFQGRDLNPPLTPEQKALGLTERKYLFPKMLPGTGRFLLNGQNVLLTQEVAMGEGFFDVAAMKIAFDGEVALRHVVPIGSFGKHLSYGSLDGNDQLGRFAKLKARGVKQVTIMWDGEEKALISALNAAKLLTGIGLVVKVALLPAGKDPNEVLPEVVVRAYQDAKVWTPALDIQWRLRNPYAARVRK